MAAPMEAKYGLQRFIKVLCSTHRQPMNLMGSYRHIGFISNLRKRFGTAEALDEEYQRDHIIKIAPEKVKEFETFEGKRRKEIEERRPYFPPKDCMAQIKLIVNEVYNEHQDQEYEYDDYDYQDDNVEHSTQQVAQREAESQEHGQEMSQINAHGQEMSPKDAHGQEISPKKAHGQEMPLDNVDEPEIHSDNIDEQEMHLADADQQEMHLADADQQEMCLGDAGITEMAVDDDEWKQMKLDDRVLKFRLLTRLMEVLDHDIPNITLHDMNTVQDVVDFFHTEVRDTSKLEDLAKLNLPKNLHINLDYIRFHPDTDQIYDGKTAFPGSPTIVTSAKYSRKYKGYDGGDPVNEPWVFEKR